MLVLKYLPSGGAPLRRVVTSRLLVAAFAVILGVPAWAQQAPPPPPAGKPTQPAPAEAGGPEGDIGPMAVPKKGEAPPEPKPQPPKKIEGMPDYSLKVDTALVQVPVLVTTKDGQFIPGLKEGNFRVLEDGVPQRITKFEVSQAPITAVLLVEFASRSYYFMYDALNASYSFAQSLKPEDWVAVVAFDMKPFIVTDFTQDKRKIFGALNGLRIPGFSETNVFDALYDTLDRVDAIEGRKYIILVASGCDTFSRMTYDKILKKVKATPNVTIFTVSTGEALRIMAEARGMGSGPGLFPCSSSIDFLQADNQMNTFSKMTGGRWFKPRFPAEMPEIFRDIGQNIRNQYLLAYHPTNSKLDGTYRKLKVEVVAPDGGPFKVRDQKGKDVKFQVTARDGYTAKHQVE
ncbi:MAG: VWA domain-containing protein [Acidobacteriia bacterium]|nr:VWA domain-containing protein [Terriglobia bacterium]